MKTLTSTIKQTLKSGILVSAMSTSLIQAQTSCPVWAYIDSTASCGNVVTAIAQFSAASTSLPGNWLAFDYSSGSVLGSGSFTTTNYTTSISYTFPNGTGCIVFTGTDVVTGCIYQNTVCASFPITCGGSGGSGSGGGFGSSACSFSIIAWPDSTSPGTVYVGIGGNPTALNTYTVVADMGDGNQVIWDQSTPWPGPYTYANPGTYNVCLYYYGSAGSGGSICSDTACINLTVSKMANNNQFLGMKQVIFVNQNSPTGIQEASKDQFKIYPNPASNWIYVEHKAPVESVKLLNVLGQEVKNIKYDANHSLINVEQVPTGLYILKLNEQSYRINIQK